MQMLILLVALVVSGCQTVPKMPEGKPFCNHFMDGGVAVCNEMGTGKDLPDVPMDRTDGWAMLPPESIEALLNYIDALKEFIRSHARPQYVEPILADLDRLKLKMKNHLELHQR